MNSRERFVAVTQFERPDYVPLLSCNAIDGPVPETVWTWQRDQGFPSWVGQRAREERLGPEWDSRTGVWGWEEIARDWDRFWGLTRVHFWVPDSSVKVPDPEVLADDGEYQTLRYADGRIVREWHNNMSRYGMPEFIKYPLSRPEDWPDYRDRWVPMEDGVYPANWDALATRWRSRDFPLGTTLPGTFSVLRELFGTALAAILFYDAPGLVHEIFRHYRHRAMRMLERFMADVRPDVIYIGEDYCYRSGCFVSPAIFREFIIPHYREEVEFARAYGCPLVIVDSDGFVESIVPLLEEAGINCLQAFEPRAGNDIVRVRARHPHFVIWGGLDKFMMDQDSLQAIDAEIERKVPPLLAHGGYFPGIDHALPPTARFRSYLHFMRRLHELTGNPEGEFWNYL